MPEEKKPRAARRAAPRTDGKGGPGLQMVAVQSIACAALLLITLLLRLAGGDAYGQLRASFEQAVMDNSVMATLAALFDTPPGPGEDAGDKTGSPSTTATTSTASATGFTGSTTAAAAGAAAATGSTTAAPAADKPAVMAVGKTLVEPPDGSSFVRLQTNLVARLPVDKGVLTSGYGYRDNPTGPGQQFHAGVDIAADEGEPIYAMFFGVVVDAGASDSYGNYIRIYHGNGLEIFYAHCARVTAEIGDTVKAGSKVALVGATGDATGNHVHIEAFQDETRYDPSGVVPVAAYA